MQDLLLAQEVNGVQTKLRDVLEDSVDEKYYLAPEKTERLVMQLDNRNKADDQIKILGHRKGYRRNTHVFDESGLTETLDTGMGGGRGHYTMETVGKGLANTLQATSDSNQGVVENYRIRKLTPRETWRLQGFPDWAFEAAEKVNSNSQLYKQAGNSVTVNVIAAIAERLGD